MDHRDHHREFGVSDRVSVNDAPEFLRYHGDVRSDDP